MEGSIATGGERPLAAPVRALPDLRRLHPAWIGLGLVTLALVVYVVSNTERTMGHFYDHFVWQADAYLHGRFTIPYPVEGPSGNEYFQDVYPLPGRPGEGLLPFPPLPAILLVPLVAVSGLDADAALFAAVLGAVNVGLAWRLVTRLTSDPAVAVAAALFYGLGTVAWYASMLGSTWFLAHVVASTFLLLALTVTLDGERHEAELRRRGDLPHRGIVDRRQFLAGFLLGLAALARLTTLFGAPFFVLVGSGGSVRRRAVSAGLGAAIPVLALVVYNLAVTGQPFNPAYEYLYQMESRHEPQGGGVLASLLPPVGDIDYRAGEWGIEDPRYIPQNALIMLAWLPEVRLECGLSLFDPACPLLQPDEVGMSLFLTSPAYLVAVPLVLAAWRRRVVLGATLAVLAIALANVMHFSQGWVQFGYRFSNDFAPIALVLVTLAIARTGLTRLTVGLIAASIAINAWGVYWGVTNGW